MRPSRHIRRVRTRRGRIRRWINPHIPKRTRRASQLRRDIIRKELVFEGTPKEKEKIVHVMEKDPYLHANYREGKYPKINIVEKNKHSRFGEVETLFRTVPHLIFFKKDVPVHHINLERKVFKQPETKKGYINLEVPSTPRVVLTHEVSHAKTGQKHPSLFYKEFLSKPDKRISEELADSASFIDVRKSKLPQNIIDKRIQTFYEEVM